MTIGDIALCTVCEFLCVSVCVCAQLSIRVLGSVLQWALECFQGIDEMTSYH